MSSADIRISTAAENPLCTRLQSKFSDRGIAAADLRRADTISIPRQAPARAKTQYGSRVRSAADPFENTAEFAPARAEKRTNTQTFAKVKADTEKTVNGNAADYAKRRTAAYEVVTPFASGAYASAYKRAADIRARAYDGREAAASAQRQRERAKAKRKPAALTLDWFRYVLSLFPKAKSDDEIKVEAPPISKGVIISIVLVAAVIMMIIFSFSQISEFKREISSLEAHKAELCEQIQQLSLDIELKNDIRAIEQAATEDIGMVKSNQVQSMYITVGDGERVEVIDNGDLNDADDFGIFSTMMSAVSSNWNDLLDYIQ